MRYFLLIIGLLLTQITYTQSNSQLDADWLEQTMDEYCQRENIPSLLFALVDSTGMRLSVKKGKPRLESTKKVTENSIYQIGSLSKLFTGIILQNLIQEGKLDPQQPFVSYLGQNIPATTRKKWSSVKVLDLIHHRAGMPNHGPSTPPTPNGTAMRGDYTSGQLLADLEQIPFSEDYLEQPAYSNYAYGLLGYIAEQVSGRSYQALLDFYVSEPYQLSRTSTQIPGPDQLVTPYFIGKRDRPTQYWQMGAETPAGSVFSCLSDLVKLQARQLGVYQRDQSTDALWLSHQVRPFDRAGYMEYGYGLMQNRSVFDSTYVKYEHGGDLDGFASQYKFFPQHGLGYILLTSSGGSWFNELDALIEQRLIGAPIREVASLDKKQLKTYEGRYRFESGFTFEIVRDQTQLKVLFPGNDPVNIYPASTDLLFFRHMNVQIQFEKNQKGKINRVIYIQNGESFFPDKVK